MNKVSKYKDLAAKNCGLFISNNGKLIKWKCKNNHTWISAFADAKRYWCSKCNREIKKHDYLNKCSILAENFNGKLLSNKYINAKSKLLFSCKSGHKFKSTYDVVSRGIWSCPYCDGRKRTIKDMNDLVKHFGGKCLSSKYINATTKLKWQCKNNHTWFSTPHAIKRHWCLICAGKDKKTIQHANELAKLKGGKCLSKHYKNAKSKLEWSCKDKHTWFSVYDSIRNGTWCPFCATFKTENWCREAFEYYLNNKFPKSRPYFLRSRSKKCFELDGYCEELNLAFEYNGAHHYRKILKFKSTDKSLAEQKRRDSIKRIRCNQNNITLITIREIKNSTQEKVFEKVKQLLIKRKLL